MKCVDIYIFQVGTHELFPFTFMQKAYQIGIKGFVFQKNKDLFIEAEGEEETLESFIEYCERCQILGGDDYIEVEKAEVRNYTSFEIIEKVSALPKPINFKEKNDD